MRDRNHTKAVVIVHGKSEYDIVKHIKSKLRIPMEIYSKNNGKNSIEIASINSVLSNKDFVDSSGFVSKFPKVERDKKGRPINFKIFMIMDVDWASAKDFNSYKDGSLFKNSWLKKALVPIWNEKNLEEVLNDIGYYYAKNDKQKKRYKKVFPVERGEQDLNSVEVLRDKLRGSKKSNMHEFLSFCLDNCPRF